MSLINQMLQDLDGRRAQGAVAEAGPGHVRVVAKRRPIHAAWWAAAALAAALAGVLAWEVLRPAALAGAVAPAGPAVLVVAPALQPVSGPSAMPKPASQSTVSKTAPMMEAKSAVLSVPDAGPKSSTELAANTVQNAPQESVTPTAIRVPAPPSLPPSVTAAPAAPAIAPADAALSSGINKQVREPTPQQRAENAYRKATVAMQQEKSGEAIAGLEQTLQLDPQHVAARQTLVGILLKNKRQDEAVRTLQDGLSLDPSQAGLAMILARIQVERGELKAAVDTLQRTLPDAVERSEYQAFLAALLQRQALHKDAIEHYSLALRKTPQSGVWWMGLGISLQAENRMPEAQEAFGRAKSSNSLSPELQAFVEQRLGQLQR